LPTPWDLLPELVLDILLIKNGLLDISKKSRLLSIRDKTSWHDTFRALWGTTSRISMEHAGNSLLPKYCLVYLASLLLSIIFLKIAVGIVGIAPEIANIFAICLTTCTNFLGTKFFVFKKLAI
jgi:hypothetical protein